MKALKDLQPTGLTRNPDLGLPGFIENLLIRTFMEPRIKEAIGWIGLAYRTGPSRGWTLRVRGRSGVYGLCYRGHEVDNRGFVQGFFSLQYFPAHDEPILDAFSVRENLLRLDPAFEGWIRSVPGSGDPFEGAFLTGEIVLACDKTERHVMLTLTAPVRWKEIRQEGLYLPRTDGTLAEAVTLGGMDRNLPAFALAWPFFDRLVLTLGYQLREPPRIVVLKRRSGPIWQIDGENRARPSHDTATKEMLLTVGYGPARAKRALDEATRWALDFFPQAVPGFAPGKSTTLWSATPGTPRPRRGNPLWWKACTWREKRSLGGLHSLGMAYRPPLLIITGFLGSGKTTLLNQVLEYMAFGRHKFVAVIQNEVGQVDVDSKLTEYAFDVTSLEEGCVCCTLRGELRQAIRKITADYEPDLIVIETTGVADPKGILAELPDLEPLVRFDSLVCVADAPNLNSILKDYTVSRSQIEWANIIVVNKADLVDDETLGEVLETLKGINPPAIVIPTTHARLNPAILFPVEGKQEMLGTPQGYSAQHIPDLRSSRIDTLTLQRQGKLRKGPFQRFLETLPDSVYRLKGVVRIAGATKPQLLQYVAHRYELSEFTGKNLKPNTLVFIGRNLDEGGLREGLERCLVH